MEQSPMDFNELPIAILELMKFEFMKFDQIGKVGTVGSECRSVVVNHVILLFFSYHE